MTKKLYIQNYCKISSSAVLLNNELVLKNEREDVASFLKTIYKKLDLKYSKFFKMDMLSKLAFLGAELILKDEVPSTKMALIFSNNASSLETDRKHQNSISDTANFYPSPAIFVYTLPNIGIGEISIKHELKSENAFFIFEKYNARFHHTYETSLIENYKADAVLAGWVNVDGDVCDVFMYSISEKGTKEHTIKNLLELYNS